MLHALNFPVKLPDGFSDMVARCAAAAPVPSADFMLRYALEKGQVEHFPVPDWQPGQGGSTLGCRSLIIQQTKSNQ